MKIDIFQVDAYTDKMFSGSSSAVCPLKEWIDDTLMQNIAQEMNLGKTAFIVKKESSLYEIRWFTPKSEITLFEHAALASAYVIFNYLDKMLDSVTLKTLDSDIVISRDGDNIFFNFKSHMPVLHNESNPIFGLSMGIEPLKVLKSQDYILIFENEDTIKDINPKIDVLKSLDLRGVCIAARGDESDFVFRYFAPKLGISEELVISSICSQLAPYWSQVLSRDKLKVLQLSKRQSTLNCDVKDDVVTISAKATLFMKGSIIIEERKTPRDDSSTSKLAIAL